MNERTGRSAVGSEPGETPRRGSRSLGFVLITCANVLAGASYPAQKLALEGLPPATVSAARNALAVLLMAIWMRATGISWGGFRGREWGRLVILGSLAYGLPMYLGIIGVRDATAANASVLVLLEPAMVIVLARIFLREAVGLRKWIGVAVGIAGALVIVLEGASFDDLTAGEHFRGNVWLALHGILWGCYVPLAKPLMSRGRNAFALTAWSLLFSLFVLVPAAVPELETIDVQNASFRPAVGWTVFLAVTGSFGATFMWILSLRWLSASTTAVFVFLQPLAGVAIGVAFLGETMGPLAIFGSALIVLGVGLGMWRRADGV